MPEIRPFVGHPLTRFLLLPSIPSADRRKNCSEAIDSLISNPL